MQEVSSKVDFTTLESDKDMTKSDFRRRNSYLIIKRLIDIIGACVGIVLLSPIYIILILLIKIDSKGPAFFPHKRLGLKGKLINVYKFRTMVTNAEEILENLPEEKKKAFEINFKFDDDPRITRVGKYLREMSLDELPQLVNILKGDMAIVGPRPIVIKELNKYGIYSDKLLAVKPGLTGYWQANGRSDTTYEERVAMDMYYIDNMSLWLDIKIIFKTALSVFKKEGAR